MENKILNGFLGNLDNYYPYIKFTYDYNKKEIPFLDLKGALKIEILPMVCM